MKPYIQKLIHSGLLDKRGFALDLGSGNGEDSLELFKLGYEVISVDKEPNQGVTCDIKNFIIEQDKYSLIIARNVLPFIKDKETVKNILMKMVNGLNKDGTMFFTIFGKKDDWFGREDMSFFEEEEIDEIVKYLPINLFEKNHMEGIGKSRLGKMKFWDVYSFVCTKKDISKLI